MVLLLILGPGLLVLFLGYWFVIRPMRQEARGLDAMARTMARQRREARREGRDYKAEATAARSMLGMDK